MAISLQTNPTSLRAQQNLSSAHNALARNIERLSSGLRINRAGDDPSGSSISEKLTSQLRSLKQSERNTNDAVSLLQIADGALNQVVSILTRMRELAVHATNGGTLGDNERQFLADEFELLDSEINRIVNVTEYAGVKLVNGELSGGTSFQVGMMNTTNDRITISIGNADPTTLGLNDEAIGNTTSSAMAIEALDVALTSISTTRAALGTTQNRLTFTLTNLANSYENLSAANSVIRDVDVAEETAFMTRNRILQQAGVAVLSQANSLPQAALSLIVG